MPETKKADKENIFLRMHPLHRFVISLGFSTITYFILPVTMPVLIAVVLLWVIFAMTYLLQTWIVILKRPVNKIRQRAKEDDGSILFVSFLVVVSSFASLVTVLLLVLSHDEGSSENVLYLPVAVSCILLSWLMVHSVYTFHYAHMYYDDDENNPSKDAHGLEFPGNAKLNYVDFAYFSFGIGCTFQVSDVEISSPRIRRVALVHSLIAFGLNTFVVALTINLIAGLSK